MFSEFMIKLKAHEMYPNNIDIVNAIKTSNQEDLMGSFIRGQPFSQKDLHGNNLLHIAAQTNNRLACRAMCVFGATLELWKQKNNAGKLPVELTTDQNVKLDLNSISTIRSVSNHHTWYNKQLVEKRLREPNNNYKVLLSLDGGGLRIVLQSAILIEIERQLGEPLRQHVHWIGGTSCGGLMAGTMAVGIDLNDARKAYILTRKRIFCGNTNMIPKHSAAGIESVLQEVMGKKTLLSDLKAHKLVITTAKCQYAPIQLLLLRSYAPRLQPKEFEQLGFLNPSKVLLWKAMRSTSAAPVYFPSFNGLVDGALFCNNPCIQLLTEFRKLKKIENHRGVKNYDEIGCVISVGTGMEPSMALKGIELNVGNALDIGGNFREIIATGKNFFNLFMYQCTTSHNVHVGESQEWAHSLDAPFFRFSPKLSSSFELDNCSVENLINSMFENEVYLRTQIATEIVEVVKLLKSMPKNPTTYEYKYIVKTK